MAEAKKVVLQPLHHDIAPEDLPDSVVAASHINGDMIGNIAGDIEQETDRIQPSAGVLQATPSTATATPSPAPIWLTVVGLVLFILVIVFVIFQQ